MKDPRYEMPVNGIGTERLPGLLRKSIGDVSANFPPKTGVCVFVFDFGAGGGLAYASNANRADMVRALREWLAKEAQKS